MSKRRVYYVLSSHWDREWYQPFQEYRYRLVQMLDRVFQALESGELAGPFQCDGQAIILEDYLEVRPEKRELVQRLARRGKLAIGPWYVMPDEFLVSGEAMIRNLRLGRQVARELGATPASAGFVCDIFGHCSQLPQILRGFGSRAAFIWRGSNEIGRRWLSWRGGDGDSIPAHRFGHSGYCTYAKQVRHASDQKHVFDRAAFERELQQHLQQEAALTPVGPLLLFDGGDHQGWEEEQYRALVEVLAKPESQYELIHGTLDDYLDEAIPALGAEQVIEGELREPAFHPSGKDDTWLIPGVLSSRVWIKQANAQCQTLLCHWAEPLSVMATALLGQEYPQGFLNVAWRWLLQNHPHDSICGCSIDQVHEDMKFRFSQCRQIGQRLTYEATRNLAAAVEGDVGQNELRVVVFNPLPTEFAGVAPLTIEVPVEWPSFNEFFRFEPKPAFRVLTAAGQELPYQRLSQTMDRVRARFTSTRFPRGYQTNDVGIALELRVPACGYTTLVIRQDKEGLPTRWPAAPGLAIGDCALRNEHLEVSVECNGSLTLRNLASGEVYNRLMTFEDCADIGDGWYHGQAVNDQCFSSTACRAEVALVHNGPLSATLRVRTAMRVPAEFRFDAMRRSEEMAELVLDSLVTLRKGEKHLDVETTVHNTAKDHRLRVLFPSGCEGATYLADSPFDVVERPIALRSDNHLYRELEVETKPQQTWTAMRDGRRGLAVVSEGLMESAVCDLPQRPIALTLLRATRRTVITNGEPEGQLLGEQRFRYQIVPLPTLDVLELCRMGQRLATGLRTTHLAAEDLRPMPAPARRLPASWSLLRVEGPAVISAMTQCGGAVEVRLFNPTGSEGEVRLCFEHPQPRLHIEDVELEGLKPVPARDVRVDADRISLTLRPKQIRTLRLSGAVAK